MFRRILKFLFFALVLARLVLVVALTALRPVVNGAVMIVGGGQPGALSMPFVRGHRRARTSGTALTTPASTDAAQVEFLVEPGDTATTIATRLEDEGFLRDPRAFVFIAIDREPDRRAPAGDVHPAQEPDAG